MRPIDADALGVGRCSKDILPAAYCAGWNGLLGLIEKAPTIEAEPVRHGPCLYCEAKTNDFVPINQSVEYSGIEIALNRQGMLRVRVYESGQETFTTQDIVEIKYCPNCGAKMDKED